MKIVYATLPPMNIDHRDRFFRPALAAGYLAAYAMANRGHADSHYIIDAKDLSQLPSIPAIAQRLLRDNPDLIAISVYVWNVLEVTELIRDLRRRQPTVRIVLGGPEVCYTPEQAMRDMDPDWICTGEGERPFLALLDALDRDPGFSRSLPGILYCNEQLAGEVCSEDVLIKDLDTIPSPYLTNALDVEPGGWVDVETLRGCPFRCSFCLYGKTFTSLRYFSLNRVRNDLAYVISRGAAYIYLMDPTFNLPKHRCRSICDILTELNPHHHVQISIEARAEIVDEAMADAFVRAGISTVEVGLQSTDAKVLRSMKRDMGEVQFIQGCELLRERGIWVDIGIIVGLPDDNESTLRRTIDFVFDHTLGHLSAYRLQVLPGSEYHRLAGDLGLVYNSKSPYYVRSTANLSEEKLEELSQNVDRIVGAVNQEYISYMNRTPNCLLAKQKEAPAKAHKGKKLANLSNKTLPSQSLVSLAGTPSLFQKKQIAKL